MNNLPIRIASIVVVILSTVLLFIFISKVWNIFYFDSKINVVDIIVNLFIVILTTGITYYLFSILPAKTRLNILKHRLLYLKEELNTNYLDDEKEFRNSYELYKEEVPATKDKDEGTLIWSLIRFKNWSNFITTFRYATLMDTYYNDYWQGRELTLLINNMVMDNNNYIDLSITLSKFNAQIKHTKTILGDKVDNIWEVVHIKDLIKKKEDNELISISVSALEDVYETANKIVKLIDKILG